ncbi:MAG: hypothetical protein ABI895_00300 [Deltaproteobacteria bacterium]
MILIGVAESECSSAKMGEARLTEKLFKRYPIWKWDDAMEGHDPVLQPDPLPDEEGTLEK